MRRMLSPLRRDMFCWSVSTTSSLVFVVVSWIRVVERTEWWDVPLHYGLSADQGGLRSKY